MVRQRPGGAARWHPRINRPTRRWRDKAWSRPSRKAVPFEIWQGIGGDTVSHQCLGAEIQIKSLELLQKLRLDQDGGFVNGNWHRCHWRVSDFDVVRLSCESCVGGCNRRLRGSSGCDIRHRGQYTGGNSQVRYEGARGAGF